MEIETIITTREIREEPFLLITSGEQYISLCVSHGRDEVFLTPDRAEQLAADLQERARAMREKV